MARVTCPNCGTVRVVVEGKRKNCRKCGTRLTAEMAQEKPKARKPAKATKAANDQTATEPRVEA
ncbi:MAG: hypothetical protein ABFE13_01565 [Phycisphaerales bacterium]